MARWALERVAAFGLAWFFIAALPFVVLRRLRDRAAGLGFGLVNRQTGEILEGVS